jgi:molecular chaperone DnaJ
MSKAFEKLGLPDTATPDEVKAKWRQLCMIHKQAHAEASEPKPCQTCSGSGKVKHSHGFNAIDMPCPTCGGSGHA